MAFKIPKTPQVELEEGTWTDYEGSKFKIAYAGSIKFARVKDQIEKPHRRMIEKGAVDPADQKKWLIQALAKAILLDWKDVHDEDGQEVQYSVNNAIQAMTNSEEFRDFVMTFSMELANFREADREVEGNS
jgi:hypothetical protein